MDSQSASHLRERTKETILKMGMGNSAKAAALALMLGGTLGINGCAMLGMGGGDKPSNETASQLISDADTKASAGEDDAAVALLKKATLKNPVDPTPWLKIAKIRFESNDYVDALVASEEVISRDQSNEEGNSIALVSSLRLAERSIGVLRSGTDLDGSMRDRAQQLASQLRETLGEDALLSSGSSAKSSSRSTHHTARRTSHRSAHKAAASHASSSSASKSSNTSSSQPSTQQKSSDDGSMNPFETLQKLPQ